MEQRHASEASGAVVPCKDGGAGPRGGAARLRHWGALKHLFSIRIALLPAVSKPAIAIAAAVGLLGFARLLHAAADGAPMRGDAPSRSPAASEPADEPELEQRTSRYLRGWRLALTQKLANGEPDAQDDDGEGDQPVAATTFAPEFYFDEEHIYIRSVTFGADRFFVLDAGRTRLPGWPCDAQCLADTRHIRPPSVRAYTTVGELDADLGFEPYEFDGADSVVAIVYAEGKLYVMNDNPPKVYVYRVDGRRVPHEDFYLAGGERSREGDFHPSDIIHLPRISFMPPAVSTSWIKARIRTRPRWASTTPPARPFPRRTFGSTG